MGSGFYFNPLPRKEGDCSHLFAFVQQKISIHSLVKRETAICDSYSSLLWDISIHSLVKRETKVLLSQAEDLMISIHSLVKRETGLPVLFPRRTDQFQSTPS